MTSAANPEITVWEYIARINEHDASGVTELCTDDHVLIDSLGNRLSGRTPLKDGWRGYFALFPDYRIEVHGIASSSESVLAWGVAAGTHASTGAAWRIPAAWRAKVVAGRLAEWQVYADNKPVYEILSRSAR
jgi:ketosteroid isomerase-like protein